MSQLVKPRFWLILSIVTIVFALNARADEGAAGTESANTTQQFNIPKPFLNPNRFRVAFEFPVLRLWEGPAPDALGKGIQDIPSLTLLRGSALSGTAVIVAPGGGYRSLATDSEGRQVADWFVSRGVSAFVLTYRLATDGYKHPVQLHDAQRAIRWVRAHAESYKIDPNRIGMIGFSAGGHLTAMASTLFDSGNPNADDPVERVSSRPDFAILCYPWIVLDKRMAQNLEFISEDVDEKTLREIEPAQNVTTQTPQTFIYHTTTDNILPPSNSVAYYEALYQAKVPVEMHIFEQGKHGTGLGMSDPALSMWPVLLQNWMQKHGLLDIRAR